MPTHDITDVKDESITLTDTTIVFKGKSNDEDYEANFELFATCKGDESTYAVTKRSIQMLIKKEDQEGEFWPRLLKDKLKEKGQVTVDWDKYVDEDEEDEAEAFDASGMNQGMGGGGMGGMGGMDMASMMQAMQGGGMGGMGGGMPGMEGMGGMEEMMKGLKEQFPDKDKGGAGGAPAASDEPDSDDDELPDLEEM